MTLQELGRSAESVAAFRHALLLAPAQADAQQADAQQAAAQQGAPRQDAARHAARRAVTLAPLQASAWHLLGLGLTGPAQPADPARRAFARFRRPALLNLAR